MKGGIDYMTVRDLIQELLMATVAKEVQEAGGDPLDTDVMVQGLFLRPYVQVRMYNGKPVIILFPEEEE